jgi:hypothetical protein
MIAIGSIILAAVLLSSSSSIIVPPFVVDAAFSSSSFVGGGSLVSSGNRASHRHEQHIQGITLHRSISHRERRAFVASSSSSAAAIQTTKRGVKIAASSSSSTTSTQLNAVPNIMAAAAITTTTQASTATSSTKAIVSTSAAVVAKILSTLTATIAGGIVAGALHAISGPDHLAAVIPRCVSQPWFRAGRVGIVWGLGHGLSATIIGLLGYAFKSGVLGSHMLDTLLGSRGSGRSLNFIQHHAGSVMEFTIGISLIIIGLLGIKEARGWDSSSSSSSDHILNDDTTTPTTTFTSTSATSHHHNHHHHTYDVLPKEYAPTRKRAVLFNGILHGFSWDGAPSLAPAVAISTIRGSITFLLAYTIGTMGAMALATSIIGEGTKRMVGRLDMPNLPQVLSLWSSALALFVGIIWCFLAVR